MRMIIEARIDDGGGGGCQAIRLAEFERLDGDLKQLGLNLAEGRSLVHEAQRALVGARTRFVVSASLNCRQCGGINFTSHITEAKTQTQDGLILHMDFGLLVVFIWTPLNCQGISVFQWTGRMQFYIRTWTPTIEQKLVA